MFELLFTKFGHVASDAAHGLVLHGGEGRVELVGAIFENEMGVWTGLTDARERELNLSMSDVAPRAIEIGDNGDVDIGLRGMRERRRDRTAVVWVEYNAAH